MNQLRRLVNLSPRCSASRAEYIETSGLDWVLPNCSPPPLLCDPLYAHPHACVPVADNASNLLWSMRHVVFFPEVIRCPPRAEREASFLRQVQSQVRRQTGIPEGSVSQFSLVRSRFKIQGSLKPNNGTDSTWCYPQSITIVRTAAPTTTALWSSER